ncbi:hypothetical protein FPHYL_6653 [Fusarium phyllophilum]|uniref:CBM-cenC domain-containing protein n=1 Tax=Fusarium phyllophilum TaxID=47803 RepID=A0A8H5JSL1_9HYPO|nr:hypothetical protein FPHYL_6653 [Fusarium phyllophilum]
MMLLKYSAAVAAFALYGQVSAGPCKPITRVTSSGLETSGTATTEASLTATSSLTVETSATVETSSAATSIESSATTFSSEVSSTTGETSTLIISTTETATLDATTTEFISTSTEASDVSTTATATTSAAPVCEFTGEYTNYVKNPSFDNLDGNGDPTADPWIILGVSTLSTLFPRTGARSMEYTYPDTSVGGSSAILQELTNTVAGHEYVFKFHWTLIEGQPLEAEACRIGTMGGLGGGNRRFIAVDNDEAVSYDVYYEEEYRITAEYDNQRLSIGFFCTSEPAGGTIKIQIDDVSVYGYYEGCESP